MAALPIEDQLRDWRLDLEADIKDAVDALKDPTRARLPQLNRLHDNCKWLVAITPQNLQRFIDGKEPV